MSGASVGTSKAEEEKKKRRIALALALVAVVAVAGVVAYLAAGGSARTGSNSLSVTLATVPPSPLIAPGQTQNYSLVQVTTSAMGSGALTVKAFAPSGLSVVLNSTSVPLSSTPQTIPFVMKAGSGVAPGEYKVELEVSAAQLPAENESFDIDVVPMLVVMLYPGFYPQNVTVPKGTQVTWINLNSNIGCCDPGVHDVSFLTGANTTSPLISRLQTWNFTFGSEGVFDYYCTVHPIMKGEVTVTG